MAAESSRMNGRTRAQVQDDPDAIRAEIRATREDLAATLSEIQEKLSPRRITDEAVGSVRRATIGRVEDAAEDARSVVKGAGENVFETIKRNPAPAVLAAVGLGWLFMEGRGRSSRRDGRGYEPARRGRAGDRYYYADERQGPGNYGYSYDEYGRRSMDYREPRVREFEHQGQGMRERAGEIAGQATDRVQEAARHAGDRVQEVAGQAAGTVQNAAETAREAAGQAVDTARQSVQTVAHQAHYRAERVGSRFGDMMEENPLLIGAAAVALGAIIGFAFPTTEKESEIMGEARDRMMERAQEVVSETAQKVQHVAQEATAAAKEAARDEAERQNLGISAGR